ncbi:MAG: hypothetical protein EB015_18430, partial [Methylocystaceae bacterium]|nr:hypothetical protein [Methylocystaceae bacterium]
KDYAEAMKWYLLAANQNNPAAQNGIGVLYVYGLGVKADAVEALKWFRLGANQGEPFAQANLGDSYLYGRGIDKDFTLAFKWYRLAAKQGNTTAYNRIGFMYQRGWGEELDLNEAVKWYRLAAEQGDELGQVNLGYAYDSGQGVSNDAGEAVKWFLLAANRGNPFAQLALVSHYMNGTGVAKDDIEALKWASLALKDGNTIAPDAASDIKRMLATLRGRLSLGEIKEAEKRALRVVQGGAGIPIQEPENNMMTGETKPNGYVAGNDEEPRLNGQRVKAQPDTLKEQSTGKVEQTLPPSIARSKVVGTKGGVKAYALVIGNSAYPTANLPNPRNDARAIAKELEALGINVDLVLDANRKKFVEALSKFADKSVGAELTMLYYAGHGVQYNGINYLIPIDTDLNTNASTFTLEAIPLNLVLDQYLPTTTRIVLLDACRDNPLSRSLSRTRGISTGLAPVSVASGTLISYATKDGSVAVDGVGFHSPYTAALLAHLADPVDINIVLRRVRTRVLDATNKKQEPWEYGSLVGDELVLSKLLMILDLRLTLIVLKTVMNSDH